MNLYLYLHSSLTDRGDFLIEFAIFTFIVVWLAYFLTGRGYNNIIAVRWSTHLWFFSFSFQTGFVLTESCFSLSLLFFLRPTLTNQISKSYSSKRVTSTIPFLHPYDFFYSRLKADSSQGRKHCNGMFVDISLVKRQDLIMRAIDALAFPYHDRVTIQVLSMFYHLLMFDG